MKTILVIDDVEVCRYTIAAKSDDYGFAYKGAPNVAEALDYLKNNRVDAILVDWHLKKEQVTESLAQLKAHAGVNTVICLMTAIEKSKAQDLVNKGDVNHYLPKPVADEDFKSFLLQHKLI